MSGLYDIFTTVPSSVRRQSSRSVESQTPIESVTATTSILPTYLRPLNQPVHTENIYSHDNIFESPPSMALVKSTPPASPVSSLMSSILDTPSSSIGLVFFPQQDTFEQWHQSEEEEDVFYSTSVNGLTTDQNIYGRKSKHNNHDFTSATSMPISSLGLGVIERLPDEPCYPRSLSSTRLGERSLSTGGSNSNTSSATIGSHTATTPLGHTLLPSPTISSHNNSPRKGKRRLPFGHTFLTPLPTMPNIPQPLVPMGIVSNHSPPSSSWRASQNNGSPQTHKSELTNTKQSSKSPLRRTDSDILLPTSSQDDGVLRRPVMLTGHLRKSSNDSEMTVKLGSGFIAVDDSQEGDNELSTHGEFRNQYQYTQILANTCSSSKPNLLRYTSHQIPKHNYRPASGRDRSSSTSYVPSRTASSHVEPPQNSLHMNVNGSSITSRFRRPVSPTLPEDLLTPHTPNTYTHRTLSSAPKRPNSPTTARESLNAVLLRHSNKHQDDSQDEEDSLNRLIESAQRFESGGNYFPITPPKSPSYSSRTVPSPTQPNAKPTRPKIQRVFPTLKSLFPPSTPPSTPLLPQASLVDQSPPGSADDVLHRQEVFDVDILSERLKTQKGRIIFAELEGFHEIDEEQVENQNTEIRPVSSRRWTLPF
ncbi:uncharacterized protein I206_103194 [Kwoniella pini CBS 10737]|uniref:Uncharacterized protein n=1 Tax=Kwoniella pini CBS 10737 TaxID=1296096 RepID=A0A1B9IA64_9TREE|nr:uncharacterized protein I206_01802 [Kwoniella pini CBS 10737]OCF52512.1 hypothetical protein I206_01802 [Kwoniella pini CBS 10737]